MSKNTMSRRDFLKLGGVSGAAFAATMTRLDGALHAAAFLRQDVTTISFAGWGGTAEQDGVAAAIAVFQQENPGIAVEWRHTPDTDFTTVFLSNIAAGTPPDTSFIGSGDFETFRKEGILLDITDQILADPLLGQPDYFLPQEAQRCADANGRWHGIGSTWVAPHLYYNATLLEAAGITPPGFKDDEIWDWDTFVANAKLLTLDANGKHPDDEGFDPNNIVQWGASYPIVPNPTFLIAAVYSNGGKFITDEGLSGLDSAEAMQALQNLSDLVHVHHVAPPSSAMASLGMDNTQMLNTNRLALAVDGSWALSWINPTTLSVPMGVGALPKMATTATYLQAHFHAAMAGSAHPEEAWQWIRFLATPFYTEQFMKIGLWLPSQTAQTTEEGMAAWLTEGIHPANYREFVSEYLPKYGVAARIPAGFTEASSNFLTPAFQAIADGSAVADVLPEAVRLANEIIAAASA
ncbi:MAG: extracellular solute-binding protein [Chloroflexi bacterium]|nr:extracellular solute-binding protein [Chloroflexota bacterium]